MEIIKSIDEIDISKINLYTQLLMLTPLNNGYEKITNILVQRMLFNNNLYCMEFIETGIEEFENQRVIDYSNDFIYLLNLNNTKIKLDIKNIYDKNLIYKDNIINSKFSNILPTVYNNSKKITCNKITNYVRNNCNYIFSLFVSCGDYNIFIVLETEINLKNYNIQSQSYTYIYDDNYVARVDGLNIIDILKEMDFVKESDDFYLFLKYLIVYDINIKEYINNDHVKNAMNEIYDMNNIQIAKYFKPIYENKDYDFKAYFSYTTFVSELYYKYDDKNIDDEILKNEKRKAEAVFRYITEQSQIDIYTGNLLTDHVKQVYTDYNGKVLKDRFNRLYFYTKIDDIYVISNHDESCDITSRYRLMEKLLS